MICERFAGENVSLTKSFDPFINVLLLAEGKLFEVFFNGTTTIDVCKEGSCPWPTIVQGFYLSLLDRYDTRRRIFVRVQDYYTDFSIICCVLSSPGRIKGSSLHEISIIVAIDFLQYPGQA